MSERMDKLPVTAAILAGGRSRRMGVDKTMLEIDGVPMVSRVASAMVEICNSVTVVTTRPEVASEAGLPSKAAIVTDEVGYLGPLGGIVTGLAKAPDPWVLVVAADMPWVSEAFVAELWKQAEDTDVVVPRAENGLEPLLALYRVDTVLPVARRALEEGERRPIMLYEHLRVAEVPVAQLRAADPELKSLVNINTPQDLGRTISDAAPRDPDVRLHVVEVGTRRARGMPSERAVTIYLNGLEIITTQATPSDLEEFAVGFLSIEGLLTDRSLLGSVELDVRRGMVFVTTDEESPMASRIGKRYVTSGCGRGITFTSAGQLSGVPPVESGFTIQADDIYELMGRMTHEAASYRETGGIHACALGTNGSLDVVREDVGRHNALDKVLGVAWLAGMDLSHSVMLTSGRISSEMAVKSARANIPIVVSRTAVTDLAAEVGSELGVTLVGYTRGGKLVVYTNPWRLREGGAV